MGGQKCSWLPLGLINELMIFFWIKSPLKVVMEKLVREVRHEEIKDHRIKW